MDNEVNSLENLLYKNFSSSDLNDFNNIYYGRKVHEEVKLKDSSLADAKNENFDIAAYAFPVHRENTRAPRIVKIGVIQHSVNIADEKTVMEVKKALYNRVGKMIDVARQEGVKIICLQELWNMPVCTTENEDWCDFAESVEEGPTTRFIKEIASRFSIVIVSPILERDESHADVLWNTAVVISDTGNIIGKHRTNHVPKSGHMIETRVYMEGNTGHPVFATRYGKIAVNIGFGRHHPLNWLMFGLNGAEIVFNPSAAGLEGEECEHMWGIEARSAAIANGYFTVAINRVGKEDYSNGFLNEEGKPMHKDLMRFYGSSYFTAPDGVRSPGLSRLNDGLLIGVVDLNLNRQVRDRRCYYMTQRLDMYVESLSKVHNLDYKPQIVQQK